MNIIRYTEPAHVDMGDHAWRVGAKTAEETQRSIDAELEAYRLRESVNQTSSTGAAVTHLANTQ
jgi:hypothetical protein